MRLYASSIHGYGYAEKYLAIFQKLLLNPTTMSEFQEFISVNVSGSADYNSNHLKDLFTGNDRNVKVVFRSTSKYRGTYVISTTYTDIADRRKLADRIRGFASHMTFINLP